MNNRYHMPASPSLSASPSMSGQRTPKSSMKPQNSTPAAAIPEACRTSKRRRDGGGNTYAPRPTHLQMTLLSPLLLFLVLLCTSVSIRSWISMSCGNVISPVPYPPLACPASDGQSPAALSCPSPPPSAQASAVEQSPRAAEACPAYFRWIHEDLRLWARTGVTRDMVERAKGMATFRLVVLGGRAYVEKCAQPAYQTRDVFTLWGILQLLRRHPGRVPDLELMFDCGDLPNVTKAVYPGGPENATAPPLFRYGSDSDSADIVFPDWSYWGWPELNIKPWNILSAELREANRRVRWVDREPYAFWKGNSWVAPWRIDLLKCNASVAGRDWGARLYNQNWKRQGFNNTDLADQCNHRFKIYMEGWSWSVSGKYTMACNSPMLLVEPRYHDFFSRDLEPLRHYWPVSSAAKCPSIKFAVDWGNAHQKKAKEMGEAGSRFTGEELKMDNVYDYMLHLLTEYAKLQRFKPAIPPAAVELCEELLACPAKKLAREYMVQSAVKGPRGGAGPCAMPPPFSPAEMSMLLAGRAKATRQVRLWEKDGDGEVKGVHGL